MLSSKDGVSENCDVWTCAEKAVDLWVYTILTKPPKKYPHQGCSNSKCWYCSRRTLEIWFKAHHRMLGLGRPLLEAIPYPHWGMHSTGRNIYDKHIWLVEYTPDGCNWEQISTISGLLMPWAMALGKNIQIATGYIILCEIQGRVFIIVYPPIVCHMCIQWVRPMYPKIIQNPLADCHRNCSPSKMVVFLGGVPPFRQNHQTNPGLVNLQITRTSSRGNLRINWSTEFTNPRLTWSGGCWVESTSGRICLSLSLGIVIPNMVHTNIWHHQPYQHWFTLSTLFLHLRWPKPEDIWVWQVSNRQGADPALLPLFHTSRPCAARKFGGRCRTTLAPAKRRHLLEDSTGGKKRPTICGGMPDTKGNQSQQSHVYNNYNHWPI